MGLTHPWVCVMHSLRFRAFEAELLETLATCPKQKNGAQRLFQFLERAPAAHKPSKSPRLPGTPRVDHHTDGWSWDDSIK
jgi:hypothetical protein